MAFRTLSKLLSVDRAQAVINGRFDTNSTSNPAAPVGQGFTVARTGVGTYAVTLTDPWVALIGATCSLSLSAPDGSYAYLKGFTTTANRLVLTIVTLNASNAAADIAANASNWVSFAVAVQHSGSKPY